MQVLLPAVAAVASLVLGAAPAQSNREGQSCPNASNATAPIGVQIRTMRCLVDGVRRSHGLPAVREGSPLDRASLRRALEIRRCGDFSHTPCGEPFLRVFAQVGYLSGGRWAVGENIGWGQGRSASPQSTLTDWLNSPQHRQILLSRRWRDGGISLVRANRLFGRSNVSVWVAQFGRRG